jgi:type IV pilus assembly protein PilC
VESGRGLAASFADHGAKFLPSTFIETIRAGEESGNLDKAFETVHEHFDKMNKMRAKVRGALAYPVFVMVIAVVVVIVLMVKVVPTFTEIFETYDSELPFVTQLLINISNFFRKGWLPILIIAILGVIAYKLYDSLDEGRLNLARFQLKIPILGNISELNSASQFANTLSTMLASGLTMTRALAITAKTIDNYYISTEVGKITGKLEQGHALGASLRDAAVMPDILVDMVGVGEETGEMEQTLHTIGGYYDTELDMAIASALAKLEPALLVGIAIVAGFIVIAMYMAMFSMYSVM